MRLRRPSLQTSGYILVILIVCALDLWIWLECKDYSCLASENAKHLAKAYEMYHKLSAGESVAFALNTITYPPVAYLTSLPLFTLLPLCESTAILSLYPFLALTTLATFFLSRLLAAEITSHDASVTVARLDHTAICCSLVTASLFLSSMQLEGYLIEYAMTALVTASIYFFLASQCLTNRSASLAFGTCLGLTALIKWTFPIYFLAIATFWLLALRNKPALRSQRLRNGITATLLAVAIASTWYLSCHHGNSNLAELSQHFLHSRSSELVMHATPQAEQQPLLYSLFAAPLSLLLYLSCNFVPPHILLALLCGPFYLAYHRSQSNPSYVVSWLSLAVSLVLFSLYPSPSLLNPEQTLRHLSPIAPLAIALAFSWLPALGRRQLFITIPAIIISGLTLVNWALPSNCIVTNSLLLGPVHCLLTNRSQDEPSSASSPQNAQSMEKLCQHIMNYEHQGYTIVLDLSHIEKGFQPLTTELYGQNPKIRLLSYDDNGDLKDIDPLTQMPRVNTGGSAEVPAHRCLYVRQYSCLRSGNYATLWLEPHHRDRQNIASFRIARPFSFDLYTTEIPNAFPPTKLEAHP